MPIHLHQAHPWHGISAGKLAPSITNVYVEIVPTDSVKYEVDKETGFLRIDRPQRYSNQCPTLYGFIPQTYCGRHIGAYCSSKLGREGIVGDGDALDICVLTERPILHGNILLEAVPIGGLRMIDKQEADDKIIAVLKGDLLCGSWTEIEHCPKTLLDRLRHYFLTYKSIPNEAPPKVEISHVYDAAEAREVIALSQKDYEEYIQEHSS